MIMVFALHRILYRLARYIELRLLVNGFMVLGPGSGDPLSGGRGGVHQNSDHVGAWSPIQNSFT